MKKNQLTYPTVLLFFTVQHLKKTHNNKKITGGLTTLHMIQKKKRKRQTETYMLFYGLVRRCIVPYCSVDIDLKHKRERLVYDSIN